MTQRELESLSGEEVFGSDELVKGERFLKVALSIEFVRDKVRDKGVKLAEIGKSRDGSGYYGVYEEGHTFGDSISVFTLSGEKNGAWISEHDLSRFEEIVGIEEDVK